MAFFELNPAGALVRVDFSTPLFLATEGVFPRRVLGFDGVRLVLGTENEVVYIDALEPPSIVGTVAIGDAPMDALTIDGRLYVASDRGLTVIHPSCPAP